MPQQGSPRTPLTPEQRVTQEFGRFITDIDQLLHSARQLSGDSASLVRQRLEDKVAQARVRLEAARGMAASVQPVTEFQRPWWRNRSVQYVGLGVLIGAMLTSAWLAGRSRE